ncbi:unnamed protein product [Acanthoscelides obtectus]|uniref:Uncharacterized protein n=1 Tax=Acanthoscelides obtectus TaxID=200917 RepID=A0A9P0PQS0_ACAOB|nr:unnamed protein product [Acanthoscelides obtectus]CAK1660288.1 hypothetical protein AOBTE_LOCUS21968 [Acanthoscelides obtectus]
MEHLPWLDCDT